MIHLVPVCIQTARGVVPCGSNVMCYCLADVAYVRGYQRAERAHEAAA